MDTGAGTGAQRAAADPGPNAEVAKALSALAALQAGAAEREAAMGDATGELSERSTQYQRARRRAQTVPRPRA